MHRTIHKIIPAQLINMGGNLLDQALPFQGVEQIDPFLLIHHWNHPLQGGLRPQEAGVGPHPHRGFSPVTFIFQGDIQHRDSLGNNVIVSEGGTQWMHAGKGITHSERPSKSLAEKGGEHEFIQFWVNTPAKFKMEPAYYLPISKKDTPTIKKDKAEILVVTGEFENVKGPAKTYSPQTHLRANAEAGATLSLNLPTSFNTILYLLNGALTVDEKSIIAKNLIWFNNDHENIEIEVTKESRFIILSGQPINEEVVSHGPFVMNSQIEIMQAMRDSQMGKMGILIEEFNDVNA